MLLNLSQLLLSTRWLYQARRRDDDEQPIGVVPLRIGAQPLRVVPGAVSASSGHGRPGQQFATQELAGNQRGQRCQTGADGFFLFVVFVFIVVHVLVGGRSLVVRTGQPAFIGSGNDGVSVRGRRCRRSFPYLKLTSARNFIFRFKWKKNLCKIWNYFVAKKERNSVRLFYNLKKNENMCFFQ